MIDAKELSQQYRGATPTSPPKMKGVDEFAKFVEERFYAMSYAKQEMREIWQGTEDLYYCNDWEWIVKGEGFERPVRFPTLRDFTKSLVDVYMQDPPDIILKPYGEWTPEKLSLIQGKKAYVDERRNSIHEKKTRRQVVEDMFFFGKGFRRVSYFDLKRKYGKKEKTLFNNVATTRLDPRQVFVDETAITLHDKVQLTWARDIIYRDIMPVSRFKQWVAMHPEFQNTQAAQPENYFTTYGLDYIVTNSREVVEKSPLWVMKVYEYENQEQDIYAIVAGGVTIYQSSLKEAKGCCTIDIADYTFEPRNDSYWGNNLATLIAPHIYCKDTIFNLELMNLKLTLQPVVAIAGDFGYNPAVHFIQPGGVWEANGQFNGKIQDSIQTVTGGNSNTKSYEMLQNLNSELSITTRADLRALEFYQNKTATEVKQQDKMMNLHNETIEIISEVESEAVLFEIFLEVMESFMDEKDEKGDKRTVAIEDYVVNKKDGVPEFLKKSGHEDSFLLSQAMIDEPARVEVLDKRSQIAQNMEKMGRMMQALPVIGNLAQIFPDSLQRIDAVGLVDQLVEAVGLDPERSFKDVGDVYDEFEMSREEILLGHNVDVPVKEGRQESIVRLKFFLNFAEEKKKQLSGVQKKALSYHIDQTLKNITRDHLTEKRAASAPPGPMGMPPGMAPGEVPPGTPPQGPVNMKQPDAKLLNIGTGPNQII